MPGKGSSEGEPVDELIEMLPAPRQGLKIMGKRVCGKFLLDYKRKALDV